MWFDEKGKKCKCAAPQYVDYVMTFSQKTIQDEAIFPSKYGTCFYLPIKNCRFLPPKFEEIRIFTKDLRKLGNLPRYFYRNQVEDTTLKKKKNGLLGQTRIKAE